MGNLWSDIKHSLQMFFRNPGFTIAAIAALALGIEANTAIFTVVNAVLLKPLTYSDADRIVEFLLPSSLLANNLACIPEFHLYQQQTSVFKEVAAYDLAGPGFNITGDRPEQIHGIHVTEGNFRLFGAPVMLGRTFTPQEDSPRWEGSGTELRPVAAQVRRQSKHHWPIALPRQRAPYRYWNPRKGVSLRPPQPISGCRFSLSPSAMS